jgi:hypothetical protein
MRYIHPKIQHVIDESMITLLKPKHPTSEFGGDFDIQYSNMSISTYKIICNNLKITSDHVLSNHVVVSLTQTFWLLNFSNFH